MLRFCAGIKFWVHVGVGLCSVDRAVGVEQRGWVQQYVQNGVFAVTADSHPLTKEAKPARTGWSCRLYRIQPLRRWTWPFLLPRKEKQRPLNSP